MVRQSDLSHRLREEHEWFERERKIIDKAVENRETSPSFGNYCSYLSLVQFFHDMAIQECEEGNYYSALKNIKEAEGFVGLLKLQYTLPQQKDLIELAETRYNLLRKNIESQINKRRAA